MPKLFCIFICSLLLFAGCATVEKPNNIQPDVTDLSGYDEYGQEMNTDYRFFWKPSELSGYVGDPMPYYENGMYSIFYLKDEGGSLRHSVYRVDTTDFIRYVDKGEVLQSGNLADSDYWIGTGSVVKAGSDYYLFYTGHNPNKEVHEKIMVAKSIGNMDNFVKVKGFEVPPPAEYSHVDFRDPQAYYDEEKNAFDITVETNSGNIPKIVKYTVSLDLQTITHEGVMFEDRKNGFWNLECADITYQNGKYFLTYSGQPNDTVWYAVSDSKFSGYGEPQRLEGKHFYAPKMVEGDKGTFLVGWVYRRKKYTDQSDLYWGGHLLAHRMAFHADNTVTLEPVENLDAYFGYQNALAYAGDIVTNASAHSVKYFANAYESFTLSGEMIFAAEGKFGFILGYGGDKLKYRYVEYNPKTGKLGYRIEGRLTNECEMAIALEKNRKYDFTYIQEGSVGVFYIHGAGALSFRTCGTNNTKIAAYADQNAFTVTNTIQRLRHKIVAA